MGGIWDPHELFAEGLIRFAGQKAGGVPVMSDSAPEFSLPTFDTSHRLGRRLSDARRFENDHPKLDDVVRQDRSIR